MGECVDKSSKKKTWDRHELSKKERIWCILLHFCNELLRYCNPYRLIIATFAARKLIKPIHYIIMRKTFDSPHVKMPPKADI